MAPPPSPPPRLSPLRLFSSQHALSPRTSQTPVLQPRSPRSPGTARSALSLSLSPQPPYSQ
eukprot:2412553-Pleurochrysis_carterae.AAC.2